MNIKQLIQILGDLPGDLEVYFDVTPKNTSSLHYKSIDEVSLIKTSDNEEFIALYCGAPQPDLNMN